MSNQEKHDPLAISEIKGCGPIAWLVILAISIILLSGLSLFLRWSVEQTMFESDQGVYDGRWIIHLVATLLLLLVLIPSYFLTQIPRLKLAYKVWSFAAIFSLLSVPVKSLYLSEQIPVYTYLAIILLFMSLVDTIVRRKETTSNLRGESRLFSLTALIALGVSIPWLLWGSLGSVMDTISVFLFGVCFGFFISRYLKIGYLEKTREVTEPGSAIDLFFDGFVAFLFLIILVSGLGQNGSQILLSLTIPVSAMILVVISLAGTGKKGAGRIPVIVISGLTLTLPLLFFDIDELSLLVGNTNGEVLSWANRAGINSFGLILAVSLLLFFLSNLLQKMNIPRLLNLVIGAVSLLAIPTIYFVAGSPGFFGDQLFVIFSTQADISSISKDLPLEQRKESLYKLLVNVAMEEQVGVRETLNNWGIQNTPYYLVNAMEVKGGPLVQRWLSTQNGVDRILESPHLRPLPRTPEVEKGEVFVPPDGTLWNLAMIRVPETRTTFGVKGKGIVIGQADSGVEANHPELAASYRGRNSSGDYNWLDPWNGSIDPQDTGGHGTGTLGIEVGATRGIAPDAEWIGCVNLARNLGNPAYYLDCMQFFFAPYPKGGDPFTQGDVTRGADIVNNSWGCPRIEGCDADVFLPAMRALKEAGIFMSAAAGNTGYYGCSTVSDPPAIYQDVFTAGSIDKVGQISTFSSVGPVNLDRASYQKPDLLAPGEQILLAAPGGTYTFASGTSFAAPHVTGVVALMWSANPDLVGDIDTTMKILLETAQHFNGVEPDCGTGAPGSGAGILDSFAAVQAAIELK